MSNLVPIKEFFKRCFLFWFAKDYIIVTSPWIKGLKNLMCGGIVTRLKIFLIWYSIMLVCGVFSRIVLFVRNPKWLPQKDIIKIGALRGKYLKINHMNHLTVSLAEMFLGWYSVPNIFFFFLLLGWSSYGNVACFHHDIALKKLLTC